jgi:hypothetical protein
VVSGARIIDTFRRFSPAGQARSLQAVPSDPPLGGRIFEAML